MTLQLDQWMYLKVSMNHKYCFIQQKSGVKHYSIGSEIGINELLYTLHTDKVLIKWLPFQLKCDFIQDSIVIVRKMLRPALCIEWILLWFFFDINYA